MSAFGNYSKDAIVREIKDFVSETHNQNPEMQINKILKELMEVVNYAIEHSIYDIENPNP